MKRIIIGTAGHIDHGKTSLVKALTGVDADRLKEEKERGITIDIGFADLTVGDVHFGFVDVPGHERFVKNMLAGVHGIDLVMLVVAADDGVMPQTIEAISHVKAAGVPVIVAVNKIDLPTANPDRIKQQLAEHDVIVEDYGGNVPSVMVSARQKLNIDGLLEMILLVADLEDLKANPIASAVGTIIEAELDKSRGTVATVLIQNGTLRPEDNVLVGGVAGKIKSMFGDNGSGMHCHQSLWKGDTALFAGDGYAGLSETALHYAGGVLKHAAAIAALAAPTTNSYKRLVPGYEAPVNLAYSRRNRSAAIRIPMYSPAPGAKRLEVRFPDPACNPYLAFAAMMLAGLDGIQNKIDPGEPLDKDIYDLSPEEMKNVPSMPASLEEALFCLEEDHQFLLKGDVFTEELLEAYIAYKRRAEADAIRLRPHPYEFALYYDI